MESPGNRVSSTEMVDGSGSHPVAVREGSNQEGAVPSNGGDERSDRGAKQGQPAELSGAVKEAFDAVKEAFERRKTEFENGLDNLDMQSKSVRDELCKLTGFFAVSQGLILTALAQFTPMVCHKWWATFFLCLFVFVATFTAVRTQSINARQKSMKARQKSIVADVQHVNGIVWSFISDLRVNETDLSALRTKGEHFPLEDGTCSASESDDFCEGLRMTLPISISLSILIIWGFFLVSSRKVVCESSLPVQATAPSQL